MYTYECFEFAAQIPKMSFSNINHMTPNHDQSFCWGFIRRTDSIVSQKIIVLTKAINPIIFHEYNQPGLSLKIIYTFAYLNRF